MAGVDSFGGLRCANPYAGWAAKKETSSLRLAPERGGFLLKEEDVLRDMWCNALHPTVLLHLGILAHLFFVVPSTPRIKAAINRQLLS